jgi:hypothetical protein
MRKACCQLRLNDDTTLHEQKRKTAARKEQHGNQSSSQSKRPFTSAFSPCIANNCRKNASQLFIRSRSPA